MRSRTQGLVSAFRTIVRTMVLTAITALLIASVALPAAAQTSQSSVPASAVEAAKKPEFAAMLSHPTRPPASSPRSADARPGHRLGLPPAGTIYDNGPINGTVYAWTINFGYQVSDSFTLTSATTITGFQFGTWAYPGNVPLSVGYLVGTSPFEGSGGTATLSSQFLFSNEFGYDIDQVTSSSGVEVVLGPGTYWLTLQNAMVNTGAPLYWDENSGPSLAQDNAVGTIASESFSIQAVTGPPQCFQSLGKLQIIHDFTQQEAGSYSQDGIVIDQAGNLYGAAPVGGDNSAGFAYRLSEFTGWLLDPLFSFFGGNSGGQPTGMIVGPNGSLYGGAQGGIQNCGSDGSQSCGLVFNLAPQPIACRSALCGWNETVPYRFNSENDGSGVINVWASDQHGNLYGTTSTGGAYGAGTVFQLTPSAGGSWTKATLYSFTGHDDGSTPTGVLAGNDGNLYGTTNGGGMYSDGVVFQLTPGGGQWTESVLHAFHGEEGGEPAYLVQDIAGNLYGIITEFPFQTIFMLDKSSGWALSEYSPGHSCQPEDLPYGNLINLTIDAAGNLYGTGTGGEEYARSLGKKSPGGGTECFYNYIFKASYDSQGWHYRDLDFLLNTYFSADGSLAVDRNGNLYGTTAGCGANGYGTVWQLAP